MPVRRDEPAPRPGLPWLAYSSICSVGLLRSGDVCGGKGGAWGWGRDSMSERYSLIVICYIGFEVVHAISSSLENRYLK